MSNDFDFKNPSLFGPVVFRPDFNNFQKIDMTQAWSMFFTASKEDKALGYSPEAGKFFTYSLLAIVVAGIFWSLIFKPLY